MRLSFFSAHRKGTWISADPSVSDLPEPSECPSIAKANLLLVAGGLALILSRCKADDRSRVYPNASELYALLRTELKRNKTSSASAELLLETLHEVAERVDPVTRDALRASLEARRQFDRQAVQQHTPTPSLRKGARD